MFHFPHCRGLLQDFKPFFEQTETARKWLNPSDRQWHVAIRRGKKDGKQGNSVRSLLEIGKEPDPNRPIIKCWHCCLRTCQWISWWKNLAEKDVNHSKNSWSPLANTTTTTTATAVSTRTKTTALENKLLWVRRWCNTGRLSEVWLAWKVVPGNSWENRILFRTDWGEFLSTCRIFKVDRPPNDSVRDNVCPDSIVDEDTK